MKLKTGTNDVTALTYLSYGLLGTATTIPFIIVSYFLMFFYTDVFGLPAYAVSIILIGVRIVDMIDDPIIGFLIGKRRPNGSTYRPFLLVAGLPAVFTAVLMFYTPNLNDTGKLVYACVTYLAFEICATFVSIASESILPMLSLNPQRRATLTSLRICFAIVAVVVVNYFVQPLINFFGKGNTQKGYFLAMLLVCLACVPILIFSYFGLKERHNVRSADKATFFDAIRIITSNQKARILFCMYLAFWAACSFKNQMVMYFFTYDLNRVDLAGLFISTGTIASFVGNMLVPFLTKKINAAVLSAWGLVVSGVCLAVIYLSPRSIVLIFVLNIVFGLASSQPGAIVFMLTSSLSDEHAAANQVSSSAWFFSTISFSARVATLLSTSAISLQLSFFGFVPNRPQGALVQRSIAANFSLLPALLLLLSGVFMFRYHRVQKKVLKEA